MAHRIYGKSEVRDQISEFFKTHFNDFLSFAESGVIVSRVNNNKLVYKLCYEIADGVHMRDTFETTKIGLKMVSTEIRFKMNTATLKRLKLTRGAKCNKISMYHDIAKLGE